MDFSRSQLHHVAGLSMEPVDACGSLPGSSRVLSRSLESEFPFRRADVVASSGQTAGQVNSRIRLHHQQEQALIMRVILGLEHQCCGCSDFNFIGTNQSYIRVKCSHCSRVCLRYRRDA